MFASQLASHMNAAGHQAILVFVFPPAGGGTPQLPFSGKMLHLNGKQGSRLWDWKAWRTLARIIKEEQPDIIQANAGDTLKYAVFSKIFFWWKQPIIFRNASTISLYIKSLPARMWNGFLFGYARKIISVSNVSAADFIKLFPRCKSRVTTIPVGIETANLNGVSVHPSSVGPVLIHVGGFTYEKNHVRLVEIFERIAQKNNSASLHLVGNGPLKAQVEEMVKSKGLDSKVTFYGFRNDALKLISQSDVLLLPSIIEGLPGVILEAFYCKTPVVAYDVGGIKEIVINDKTGRLIKSGDEDEFVNGVLAAADKNEHNSRLVENAYQLAEKQYLNINIARRFLEQYEMILQ